MTPRYRGKGMKGLGCLSITLSLSVGISSFFVPAAHGELPSEPIQVKIGVLQSLTGIAAEYGKTITQSLQMAADDINAAGDVKVSLILEDDRTQAKDAVAAFQKLSMQGVDVVVGASWDFTTNAILPLAARNKVALFNTSTIKESLTLDQSGGYGFHNGFLAEDEVKPFVKYLDKNPAKRATIVYANNSWGEIQRVTYAAALKRHGVEIVDELKPTGYDENEWTAMLPRIKSKAADLVLLLINKSDIEVFLRKAREQRIEARFYSSVNGYDALRLASDKAPLEGVCFSYPLEQLDKSKDFAARYEKRFGERPRIYADGTYDAVTLIVAAVKASREEKVTVSEALKKVSIDGLVGHYSYSAATSFCIQQDSLLCVRGGKIEIE